MNRGKGSIGHTSHSDVLHMQSRYTYIRLRLTGNQKSWMIYKASRRKYSHSFCVLSLNVIDIFQFDHILIKVGKISNMIIEMSATFMAWINFKRYMYELCQHDIKLTLRHQTGPVRAAHHCNVFLFWSFSFCVSSINGFWLHLLYL
jgi:hypothetical protein